MKIPDDWKIPLVTYTTSDGLAAPPGSAVVYFGFVQRIPHDQAIPDWSVTSSDLDCLIGPKQAANIEIEAAPGIPLERVATVDCATGDVLLLYRGAFKKVDRLREAEP